MRQPAGIYLKGAKNIVAQYNEVVYSSYAGIRIGWQTGGPSPVKPGEPYTFTVQNNLVHHYGLGILSDFGGEDDKQRGAHCEP